MNWKIERIIPRRGGFSFPIRHPISYFHRCFRAHQGTTPRAHRMRQREVM